MRTAPRPGRPHLPADERLPSLSEPAQDGLEADAALDLLRTGELTVEGRLVDASNATLFCAIASPDGAAAATCVYKPVRGERPLWDFPDGTLAGREYASWLLSEATGWSVVPPTVLRDGPFGPGMVQWWVEVDESVDVERMVRDGDPGLRRMALFDAVANNADRKGGHLLPVEGGHVYGCDHGLTFHEEDKLRTVLWGWRGDRFDQDETAVLDRLAAGLASGGELRAELAPHLTRREVAAAARRVRALQLDGRFPRPPRDRHAIPWPPF